MEVVNVEAAGILVVLVISVCVCVFGVEYKYSK